MNYFLKVSYSYKKFEFWYLMLLIMYGDHTLDCYHELLFLTLWWPYSTLWWHVHTLLVKFKMALIVTSFTCYEMISYDDCIVVLHWLCLFCGLIWGIYHFVTILILITPWLQWGLLFIYLFFFAFIFYTFCILVYYDTFNNTFALWF